MLEGKIDMAARRQVTNKLRTQYQVVMLGLWVPLLAQAGEPDRPFATEQALAAELKAMSAATVDRILEPEKRSSHVESRNTHVGGQAHGLLALRHRRGTRPAHPTAAYKHRMCLTHNNSRLSPPRIEGISPADPTRPLQPSINRLGQSAVAQALYALTMREAPSTLRARRWVNAGVAPKWSESLQARPQLGLGR